MIFFVLVSLFAPMTMESQQKYLYQALLKWKDTLVQESLGQRCINHREENKFYEDRITFEETESLSQVRKCTNDSSNCVQWTFFKDAKVIEYNDIKSETNATVIVQIDVDNFIYMRRGNSSFLPSNAIEIESMGGTFKTINVKHPDSKTIQQIDLHKKSPEMQKEFWYKWTELVLKDTRVKKYFEQERIMAERKYLQLPFIQHFSLTDGKIHLNKDLNLYILLLLLL